MFCSLIDIIGMLSFTKTYSDPGHGMEGEKTRGLNKLAKFLYLNNGL